LKPRLNCKGPLETPIDLLNMNDATPARAAGPAAAGAHVPLARWTHGGALWGGGGIYVRVKGGTHVSCAWLQLDLPQLARMCHWRVGPTAVPSGEVVASMCG
jgi:hypothetical protein